MNHIPSYPSIYALGHRAIADIFSSPVVIEEKVDGSQFSMSIDAETLKLSCRSKGKDIVIDAPEKMFMTAVEIAKWLPLHIGWTYRCEYLSKPKHNTLAYARVPRKHLIVFDVMTGPETYLTPTEKRAEADRIGLECVPCFYDGTGFIGGEAMGISEGRAEELLQNDSILGGCKVEGFVVKNYAIFTPDKKIAIAKYVSEAFKEKHKHEWKKSNPTAGDFVQHIIGELKTEARWNKAIQHLRDDGRLDKSPKDIGALIKEVQMDAAKEEEQSIKDSLYQHFWPQIQRGIIAGLPEWYKEKLAGAALTK